MRCLHSSELGWGELGECGKFQINRPNNSAGCYTPRKHPDATGLSCLLHKEFAGDSAVLPAKVESTKMLTALIRHLSQVGHSVIDWLLVLDNTIMSRSIPARKCLAGKSRK